MFDDSFSVHLIVKDVEQSIDFYTSVLKFAVIERKGEPSFFAILEAGPAKLHLSAVGVRGDSLLEKTKGLGVKFQVKVMDVDGFYEHAKGLVPHKITQELSTYDYGWRLFSVTDWDGYEWAFYETVNTN